MGHLFGLIDCGAYDCYLRNIDLILQVKGAWTNKSQEGWVSPTLQLICFQQRSAIG